MRVEHYAFAEEDLQFVVMADTCTCHQLASGYGKLYQQHTHRDATTHTCRRDS